MNEDVLIELQKYVNEKKRDFFPQYFQAYEGGYGDGDKFLGVTVPHSRKVARKFKDASIDDIEKILRSPYHEMRLVALIMLVNKFEVAEPKQQEEIYEFYLEHIHFVNNWDLVDTVAYKIMGEYVQTHPEKILYKFAASKDIWEKRTAMVATLAYIKRGELKETYKVAEILLHDSHDLVQKAVGWMLREAGDVDQEKLIKFLDKKAASMPKTMLRAAIEKFPEKTRKAYLNK